MREWLLLLSLICAVSRAGGREGHGGDPLWYRFYDRAKFGMVDLERRNLLTPELRKVYREAFQELRFEISDDTLLTTGRVVDDPERPGKKWVRLDRKKFAAFFERPGAAEDTIAFAVHEVFETRELDIEKEITRELHFREEDFSRWLTEEPSSNRVENLTYAGALGLFLDREAVAPSIGELMQAERFVTYSGRCFSSLGGPMRNGLLNLLLDPMGALRYYTAGQEGAVPEYFDDRFTRFSGDPREFTVLQGLTPARVEGGSLVAEHPDIQRHFEMRRRRDWLLVRLSVDQRSSRLLCVFHRRTSVKTFFELFEKRFEGRLARLANSDDEKLLRGQTAVSIPLRCYNAGAYAENPTNGLLVGYRGVDGGSKFFAFSDPARPADYYDRVTFSREQLMAVEWAKSVSWSTSDLTTILANGPSAGFRIRRFDDIVLEGERCRGDHPDGTFELVRIVNLVERNGTRRENGTAWICQTHVLP